MLSLRWPPVHVHSHQAGGEGRRSSVTSAIGVSPNPGHARLLAAHAITGDTELTAIARIDEAQRD